MHALFVSSLHGFVELGGDRLMSCPALMCLTQSLSNLGGEAFLDILRF